MLALAYIIANQPKAALQPLQESLAMTEGTEHSAFALYLKGAAQVNMGQLAAGAGYIEDSLELDASGHWAAEAHHELVEVYRALGNEELTRSHQETAARLDGAALADNTS